MHHKNQPLFKSNFSQFWEGFGGVGNYCWASFWLQNSIFFVLFLKLLFFIDFEAFWEGFGRVWGGFKEGLWTVWEVWGEGLAGFGEGLGKV